MSLLIYLGRIETLVVMTKAGVHLSTTSLWQVGHGEIEQGVHEQHHAVLIAVAVPPLGSMKEGMAKAGRGLAVAYEAAEHAQQRCAEQILP